MKSMKFLLLLIIALPFLFSCETTTETETCATPTFNVPSGTYTTTQSVTIASTTADAIIKYTTDGTAPDTSSTAMTYSGAINVESNKVIKAVATKTGWNNSSIATVSYIVYKDMAHIAAGTFTMGRTVGTSNFSDELPIHSVTLTRAYYISKYEVTQADYQAIMGNNPSQFIGSTNPVEKVSWYHTLVYCNKRSLAEGLTPVYTISGSTNPTVWGTVPTVSTTAWNNVTPDLNANGYRLPTEAEWEYAARGGATTPDYIYAGGDTAANYAWYSANSNDQTKPIGGKTANSKGIYDMSGNVSEWVWDWYGSTYYASSPATNPTGPNSGTLRVHRGGSWFHGTSQIRVAYRDWGTPENAPAKVYTNRLGFRVVRTAE